MTSSKNNSFKQRILSDLTALRLGLSGGDQAEMSIIVDKPAIVSEIRLQSDLTTGEESNINEVVKVLEREKDIVS